MQFDVVVVGAGAAGMMCAAQAGQRGRRVLLIEHAEKLGERIRISGGGRCNFTNRTVGAENYLSQNSHFCRSPLARYGPLDFIKLVERYGIAFHEKTLGQLFCDESALDIIRVLKSECARGEVKWAQPCTVEKIERLAEGGCAFRLLTSTGTVRCAALVIATGGLAAPALGASPFGYRVAEQFGLPIVPPKPALVPLALSPDDLHALKPLSGVSFDTLASCKGQPATFREQALLTHRGLSGPAILQISSYWQMQDYAGGRKRAVSLDLLPGEHAADWLARHRHGQILLANLLAEKLPRRFAQEWCALHDCNKPMADLSNKAVSRIATRLKDWELMPSGTLGYGKAEVTLGGVDTRALSSKTLEAVGLPGLYFIGEVVDVTGELGGFNFQWAWAAGYSAGQYV